MSSEKGTEPVHIRLRAIREASGATQAAFLPALNREAARRNAREYTQSTLSKLESGVQTPSFDDIAIFAAVDVKRRGKLWLAWGETRDTTYGFPETNDVLSQLREAESRPASELLQKPKPSGKGKRRAS